MSRFEPHSHTMYSNLRLLDSINRPQDLIDRAIKLGLSGIAITDHESLGSHIVIDKYAQEIKKDYPDFKIAKGNEIYLTDTRESGQYYYHNILIAKDAIGHKMLRELSSTAWTNSFYDRGMERVPTLKSELKDCINKYGKGHLIMSSACLAGEINHNVSEMIDAENIGNSDGAQKAKNKIISFILFVKELFDDDFYLEIAPGRSKEQLAVNKRIPSLADCFDCKIIIGTDAHYLSKEDRYVHKAYLNSKGGEREVDAFYSAAYLQTEDEIIENLKDTGLDYNELVKNSEEIYDKIEDYTLYNSQQVPQVEVKEYPKIKSSLGYKTLDCLYSSDNSQERYWINECINKLKELDLYNDTYLSRLEEEADIQKVIGEKLGTCMFSYPIFLQHYIDLFWECGSTVGAGRGSSCAGLNHYLLGITQLDPIQWALPYWR